MVAGVDTASAVGHRLARRVWGVAGEEATPAAQEVVAAVRPSPSAAQGAAPARGGKGARDGQSQPPAAASPGQDPQGQDGQKHALTPEQEAALRARFGSNVLISPDGRITKQYYLTGEAGFAFLGLLVEPGKPPSKGDKPVSAQLGKSGAPRSLLARMIGDHEVELYYMPGFERPEGVKIRDTGNQPSVLGEPPRVATSTSSALLLVTAKADGLAAFENALNLFFANVPQVEIEVKVIEYSTVDSVSFGISQVDTKTPTIKTVSSNKLIKSITSQFPLSAPLIGATSIGDRGIITLGGIHDALELNARLEVLEANNVADVLSSPKMVVRNGGLASVSTTTEVPYPKAKITSSGQNITSDIQFKPVGVTLNIRPVIAGTKTVILQVYAKVSAVTGFAATEPVQTPIISTREAVTSVHVIDGKTTVIGGLVSRNSFDQTQKLPILGDIPLLGYLFRSTSTQHSETTLEFHITPRIIQGGSGFAGQPVGG